MYNNQEIGIDICREINREIGRGWTERRQAKDAERERERDMEKIESRAKNGKDAERRCMEAKRGDGEERVEGG